jgi:hypothetical protein
MSIETWGASHPVFLSIALAVIASLILSPFSNDLRALYSALPKGVRAMVRVARIGALRRARRQLADPGLFARTLATRCGVVTSWGVLLFVRFVVTTNREFDLQFRAPLSDIDRALGNTRIMIDFVFSIQATVMVVGLSLLFTAWQFRDPLARIPSLKQKLGPMTQEEEELTQVNRAG